jgi:hypothetical protein
MLLPRSNKHVGTNIMNWVAISAVADAAAALGVVASLTFVGFQVQQNSEGLRYTAVQGQMSAFQEVTASIVASAEAAEVWGSGLENPEALEGTAQQRFYIMANRLLHTYQGLHWQYEQDILDDTLFHSMTMLLRDLSGKPGFRKVWANRRHHFESSFRNFVDKTLEEDAGQPLFPELSKEDG